MVRCCCAGKDFCELKPDTDGQDGEDVAIP